MILGLKVNFKYVKFDFMLMLMVFEWYYVLGGLVCYFRKWMRKFCEEIFYSFYVKSISFLIGVFFFLRVFFIVVCKVEINIWMIIFLNVLKFIGVFNN